MGYYSNPYAETQPGTYVRKGSFNVNAVYSDMLFEKRLAQLAAQKAQQDAYRRMQQK